MKATRPLSRRSFVARVAGGVFAAAAATILGGRAVAGQVSDRDPSDPYGQGGGGGPAAPRTGITDRDPTDPAGNGGNGGSGQATFEPGATTGNSPDAQAQTGDTNSGEYGNGPPGSVTDPVAEDGSEPRRRRCSDADASPGDPSGRGRRC